MTAATEPGPPKAVALTVEAALAEVLAGVVPIADTVRQDLLAAHGRVLAMPVVSPLTQPPFAASAMDGYAVRAVDLTTQPVTLKVVGESAAGRGYRSTVGAGEAVRIFTGAPVPAGADVIVIQEDAYRVASDVTIAGGRIDRAHIRPQGGDFHAGQQVIAAGTRLAARHLTLAAAAGQSHLLVRRPPVVAILATGDELVMPGTIPGPDQIVCSNPFGVAAIVAAAGGTPRLLGIARDTVASLQAHIDDAADADILVTLGGASVGDHDLVGPVLLARGATFAFVKIAMRPGKPMMFGRLGATRVLGLPGNPVSSLITARLFLVPLVRALLGLPSAPATTEMARLSQSLEANGPRMHFMRAIRHEADGVVTVQPVADQDSSLLAPLAAADCLIVRPIGAPPAAAGTTVPILALDF